MSPTNVNFDGQTFQYPSPGEAADTWGDVATQCMLAASQATLQHVGGAFYLLAEVDFGPSYGVKTLYYQSQSPNPATSGTLRLARVDEVVFRNAANSANLPLGVNSSNQLTFNGTALGGQGATITVVDTATIDLTLSNDVLSAVVNTGSLNSTHLASNANIARTQIAAGSAYAPVVNDASGVMSSVSLTPARVLVSDANGAPSSSNTTTTQLSSLDTTTSLTTQLAGKLPLAGGTMTGDLVLNADPSIALGAATKQYVDSAATGLHALTACVAATTANISLTGEQTIDGVGTSASRVLVKSQSSQPANGVYVTSAGAWSRSTDADTWQELIGALVFVTSGTLNANTQWVSQTTAGGTLGSTAVTFAQSGASTSYTADGQGIELSGTQFALELDGTTLSKSASGLRVNASAALSVSSVTATTGTFTTATISGSAPMITGVHGVTVSGGAESTGPVFNFVGSRGANVSRSGTTITIDAPTSTAGGGGGATSPGGSNTQVQFNDSGSFGGDAGLTYNKTTDTLTVETLTTANIAPATSLAITCDALDIVSAAVDWTGDSFAFSGGDCALEGVYSDPARTTLGSAASTLTVSSIGAYDFLDIDMDLLLNNATGSEVVTVTFNGSGSGYSYQVVHVTGSNGGSGTANAYLTPSIVQTGNTRYKLTMRITNKSATFKQWIGQGIAQTDAATEIPLNMWTFGGCWNNSAARISSMTLALSNSAQFQTGSQVVVRGTN